MRAVVQRVSRAEVRAEGEITGRIGSGLLVLAGIGARDTAHDAGALAEKIVNLRIMDDDQRKPNQSILEAGGGILCVSQFTLYGDARHGRRPSYVRAAPPSAAQPLYELLMEELRARASPGGIRVESGRFRAMMQVELVNDGPVTLLLDTEQAF